MAKRSERESSPVPKEEEESQTNIEVGFKSDIVKNTSSFMDHLSKIMNVTPQSNMSTVAQKVRDELEQRQKALLAIQQAEEYIDKMVKKML